MNILERAQSFVAGAKILSDWIGDGGQIVDNSLAQSRADTCLQCPKHNRTYAFEESIANVIKQQLELKKHLQLRVQGEKSLHVCDACGCAMRLKIWLPLKQVLPERDEKDKFDKNCWLLTEQV